MSSEEETRAAYHSTKNFEIFETGTTELDISHKDDGDVYSIMETL